MVCCLSLILWSCLTLGVAHWLRRWPLWSTTCPTSGSGLSPTQFLSFCLSMLYSLIFHTAISSLPLSPSLVCFQQPCPLHCVLVFSSLFIVLFFFLHGGQHSQWYASLSQGWLGEYHVILGAYLFGLLNVSQAGLEVASGGPAAICFLSVMWCGVFYRLGVWSVEVLILFGALFLPSVAPVSQQDL
jgi:hypothetical protein